MNALVIITAVSFGLVPMAWIADNAPDIRRRLREQRAKRAARRNDRVAQRQHRAYQRIGGQL